MASFIPPFALQPGLYLKEYLLAESFEATAEYLPPQPGVSSHYGQSFGPPSTVQGHQGDAPLSDARYFGVQGGESTLGDVNRVHFEEPGSVAGPSLDVQQMPSEDDHYPNHMDNKEGRPKGLFPCQLHSLMEDHRAARLIYWDPEGKKIIVPDSEALEQAKLLSAYFTHNNWSSVVRQLGSYGFSKGNRARPGGTDHVYFHPKFLRDHKKLLNQMKSKSQGGDSGKSSVARLRKEIEEMEERLSCSEKEKKALEEKLSCSEKEKQAMEARNQYLEVANKTLKAQLLDALLQLCAWRYLPGVASAVPEMPPNGIQAASSGQDQEGPMNAPVAPIQGANTDTTGGSQLSGLSDAMQYATTGPGHGHWRGSVTQLPQQQAPRQGPWLGKWKYSRAP